MFRLEVNLVLEPCLILIFGLSRFFWRFLYLFGAYSTTVYLQKTMVCRGVVQVGDDVCLSGWGSQEIVEHLFFYRNFFTPLWHRVRYWSGVSSANSVVIKDHFIQFGRLASFPRFTHPFLTVVWFSCVWTIWKERNTNIFNNKNVDMDHMFDEVNCNHFCG